MRVLVALFITVALYGQTGLTFSASSTSIRAGQTVTFTVGTSGTASAAAVQYDITGAPANWVQGANTAGAAATTANKQVKCGPTTRTCVTYPADNRTLIGAGVLATHVYTLPTNATPGTYQVSLANIVAGNASAQPVTLTIPPVVAITVLSPYDLNSDGVVDATDVNTVVDQIIGVTACTTGDLNGDTKCNTIDLLLLVVKGVLGL